MQAAAALGRAASLTGLMRAVPFHAHQRRVYLPTALVQDVAMEMGELFELRPHAGLARAVERLWKCASGHLATARRLAVGLPRRASPVLLQAALTAGHLKALRAAQFDVFAPAVQSVHPLRIVGLLWRAAIARY